jgi:hypothetical protein
MLPKEEPYSDEETARRRDELAKRMLNMPPRPLKPKIKDGSERNHKPMQKKLKSRT